MYSRERYKNAYQKERKITMRVTKLIREYVEETINGIYEPLIKNCDGDYYEKKNEVEKILEKLADEFDAAAKKIIKENGFSIDSWDDREKTIITYTCNFGNKEYMPILEKRRKLRDEKKQKVQDILVNLELGGTKAELDEMLKKIKEEVVG